MTSVVEIINHYQKSIDKSLNDEARLLHCISKLYKFPILVQHLQETGIGRTVNALRKYDGEVGIAAKALVTKWKSMVAAEESEEGNEVNGHHESVEDKEENHESDSEEDKRSRSREKKSSSLSKPNDHSSSSRSSKQEPKTSLKDEKTDKTRDKHREDKHKNGEIKSHSSSSDKDKSKHRSSSSSSSKKESSQHHQEKENLNNSKHHTKSSSSSCSSSSVSKASYQDHKRKRSSSGEKHTAQEKKSKHKDSSKHSEKSSSSSKNEKSDQKKPSTSSSGDGSKSSSHKSSKEKSKSSSTSSSKKTDSSASSSKTPTKSKKVKEEKIEEDENDGFDQTNGASFADALAMIGFPSTSKGSCKKLASSIKESCDKIKITPSPSSSKSDVIKTTSNYDKKTTSKQETYTPQLLTQKTKLDPLPDITSDIMPLISTNYKPMPLNQTVMDCVFSNGRPPKRQMTDEEAFGSSTSSKNLRTKVYSGVKSTKIEPISTLYELCIRLLKEHIDEIEYTGGIPFYIIKPVIELASPEQLFNLEHHNPYLTEDSDVLWEQHSKRKFRGKTREEFETWREMFWRCRDEQDAKLKSLTQNIKLNQEAAALPIRKTQMAFVDTAVKPPRNIQNKQTRFGTDRLPIVSPAARVASLNASTPNVTKVGDNRLRIASGTRDTAQAQVFHVKNRKAPLMQKSLALMKGRFKRK